MSGPDKSNITDQRFHDDATLRYLVNTEPARTHAEWLAYFHEQFGSSYIVTAPQAPRPGKDRVLHPQHKRSGGVGCDRGRPRAGGAGAGVARRGGGCVTDNGQVVREVARFGPQAAPGQRLTQVVGEWQRRQRYDTAVAGCGADYLAALRETLMARGLKCELNDRGTWPRLRIQSPFDIDSDVAEFDNNVLAVRCGSGDWWFSWPWSEPISRVTDVTAAADHITENLGWGS